MKQLRETCKNDKAAMKKIQELRNPIINLYWEIIGYSIKKQNNLNPAPVDGKLISQVQEAILTVNKMCEERGLQPDFAGDIASPQDVAAYCRKVVEPILEEMAKDGLL